VGGQTQAQFGRPNGEQLLYHDGAQVFNTIPEGIELRGTVATAPSAGGPQNSKLRFENTSGAVIGLFGYDNTESLKVSSTVHGGNIALEGEDAAGATSVMLDADPEGSLDLYFDNSLVMQTQLAASGGLLVNNLFTGAGFERVLTVSDLGAGGISISDADGDTQIQVEETADEDIIRFDLGDNVTGFPALANALLFSSGQFTLGLPAADVATTVGGPISLTAGGGNTTGAGGDIDLTAGQAGDGVGADGGNAVLIGGEGGSGAGGSSGGNASLIGGESGSTSGDGGDVVLTAGLGNAGTGGDVVITGGAVPVDSFNAGKVFITGGAATLGGGGTIDIVTGAGSISTGSNPGGTLTLAVGDGGATANGGQIIMTAGSGGNSGANQGGDISITAGDSGSGTSGAGGDLSLTSGDSVATNGDGGDISLTPGAGAGSGTDGAIVISQTTAPSPTTDKLYNIAGALTWNGIDLTAGVSGLDSLTDVTITTPATGGVLYKSAGDWLDTDAIFIDPAAEVSLNHNGSLAVSSDATGLLVTDPSGADPLITFHSDGQVSQGNYGYLSGNLIIRNANATGDILFRVNTSELGMQILQGGAVESYYDNVLTTRTATLANGGLEVDQDYDSGFNPIYTRGVGADIQGEALTSSETRNDTTSLSASAGLSGFALEPSATYILEAVLSFISTVATNGFRWAFDFNGQIANLDIFNGSFFSYQESASADKPIVVGSTATSQVKTTFDNASVREKVRILLTIVTQSDYVAGTAVDLEWAQGTAIATDTTLEGGSFISVRRIK